MKATPRQIEQFKQRYRQHKAAVIERTTAYYFAHKDEIAKKRKLSGAQKAWEVRNKEHRQAYLSEWYIVNKERVLSLQKEYAKNNKERLQAYASEYLKRPEVKEKLRLSASERVALKKSVSDGSITEESVSAILEKQKGLCLMCWREIDRFVPKVNEKHCHLDHIYPLSKGGGHTIENVQWLCASCNRKKGAKIINLNIPVCV